VLKPCAIVELVWRDETGSTSATTVFVSSSATVSEIDASAAALASILLPLSGAVLVAQRIKYQWVPEAPVAATDGSPIVRAGAFFFNTGESTPMELVMVRAVKDAIVSTIEPEAGVAIDTSHSDVIAFIDTVVDGIFTNPFGDDIVSFEDAYIQSRI